MEIKLFTHNDLDGVGCAILALLAFDRVDIEYCDYKEINNKVRTFVENRDYNNYDHVYITDISIDNGLVNLIEGTHPDYYRDGRNLLDMLTLIDHHPTAVELDRYRWCTVITENEQGKTSGTSLFYDILLQRGLVNIDYLRDFVELVRQYDTWEWRDVYNNEIPGQLNNLLWLYGRERFVSKMVEMLRQQERFAFDQMDLMLLDLDRDKKQAYYEKKSQGMLRKNLQNYNVGVVFAEQYISELGNYLAERFRDLDFIVLIGDKTISYRGIRDIDLGAFAMQFGGGGHPRAAGSRISISKQEEYIDSLFS